MLLATTKKRTSELHKTTAKTTDTPQKTDTYHWNAEGQISPHIPLIRPRTENLFHSAIPPPKVQYQQADGTV